MRVLLVWVAVMLGPAAVTAEQWLPQCAPEKSELVRSALRKRAPLEDPRAIQGDEAAELLYLLLAAEMFRETGDALPGLPFPLSSPLNRAASDAYRDYVKGLGIHSSFVGQFEEHGTVAAYALMAIHNTLLPEESVYLLEAAGARGTRLRATTVGQYVTLRMSEPGDHLGKVRRAVDWGGGLSQANVVYLRLSELMPASAGETIGYVRELAKRGTLRRTQRLAAKSFLALIGTDESNDITLDEADLPGYRAFQKAIVGTKGSCLTNRGYVFNSSVQPGGRR